MQGQKGTFGSLPETLALEHGSSSSDSGVIEQQICWNNYLQNPTNTPHENQNVSMWNMGEASSSSAAGQSRVDPKTEHGWPSSASMLSLGDVNMNRTHNQHAPLFMQNPRPESIPHNATVNPSTFIGIKPSNYASGSSSSHPIELEGRQLPCKRKAVELSIGQSSSSSSNMFQRPENPLPPSDSIIPRLGLGVGASSSDNRNVENSQNARRNVRIRINNSCQQDVLPANNNNSSSSGAGGLNVSSSYPSLRLNPVDLRSPPVPVPPTNVENLSSQETQPVLRLPALRRNLNLPTRWTRSSASRANRSSNNINISGETSRPIPANISDHPIFVPPRNATQTAANWSINGGGGGNVSNAGNPVAASSNPSSATAHRGGPHYPSRRLSEILRRSFLSSMESGAGNGNLFSRIPPPVGSSSQEAPVVGMPGHRHHLLPSRSSDRHLDAAFGFPYLGRSAAGGSEGRGRLVSEIRNVLDLIRRGEGLRFEDVMILDPSVLYGMADIHDRHRDMRLDIDNMSYEELLALEERIGNVNTGLTEETVSTCLQPKMYVTMTGEPDAEPCCICQEEYEDGDDLGGLKCGHDFHTNCIKKWLLQKNACPVCKSAAK